MNRHRACRARMLSLSPSFMTIPTSAFSLFPPHSLQAIYLGIQPVSDNSVAFIRVFLSFFDSTPEIFILSLGTRTHSLSVPLSFVCISRFKKKKKLKVFLIHDVSEWTSNLAFFWKNFSISSCFSFRIQLASKTIFHLQSSRLFKVVDSFTRWRRLAANNSLSFSFIQPLNNIQAREQP